MSSKRGLYKPAVQKELVGKEKRKTLAQGRLVSRSSTSDQLTKAGAKAKVLPQGKENKEKSDVSYTKSLSQSARQNLTSLLKSETSFTSLNPRRITPHVSEHASPGKSGPSHSLDLSDTESEAVFKNGGHVVARPSEVLVVDASSDLLTKDDSEIEIRMQYVHSPAKIICHSPAKVHGDLRDTGDIHRAQKIPVDLIPSVSILAGPEDLEERQHSQSSTRSEQPLKALPQHKKKSPMVIHETSVVSNMSDSSRSPRVAKMLFSASSSQHEPPGDDESSVGEFDPVPPVQSRGYLGTTTHNDLHKSASESSLENCERLSDVSEISETSKVGRAPPPKTKSAALSTSEIKKKKKATRVVASRFMASATSVAKKGPMKATDRSIITKSSTTSMAAKKPDITISRSRKPSTPSKKKRIVAGHNTSQPTFSTTPEVKGQGGKVSTPTCDGSMFVAPGGVDVSAIGPSSRHFHHLDSTPNLSESTEGRFESSISHGHNNSSSSSKRQRAVAHNSRGYRDADSLVQETGTSDVLDNATKKPQKVAPRMTQKRLDLTYARYVQWVFLESKQRKALEEQEKKAMSQLYALWTEVEKLRQKDHELDVELARLRHLNMLDELLDTQASGLEPVVSTVPQLTDQYSLLAKALDTTRHQMPAKGIHIPSEQDEFAQLLLHALGETEQLLGEIGIMVQPESPRVTAFSDTLRQLESCLTTEVEELAKCKELLAAAGSLTTQESSLQIQEIQENTCSDVGPHLSICI